MYRVYREIRRQNINSFFNRRRSRRPRPGYVKFVSPHREIKAIGDSLKTHGTSWHNKLVSSPVAIQHTYRRITANISE